MKEVIFKHVSIKNFLSIGDDPIDIKFNPGIHIITGINKDKEDSKNGVGKSTISDAIFFAIFGSPLRPIKKEIITNWINKKDCSVTIAFDVITDGKTCQYTLLRTLNPSRVQLIKDGEDMSRTIGKTNETIYDILGTTPEMFEQSVIMCLNQAEPFLSKTPAIKRKFIEDIFKIEIFGRMTQFIRSDFNETKRLLDSETEKNIDLTNNIQIYKKQQVELEAKKKARIEELTTRKTKITEEIKEINAQAAKHKLPAESKEDIQLNINKIQANAKQLIEEDKQLTKISAINQTTVLNINSKIKELEKLADGVCAYCKQPFSESNKEEKRRMIETHQAEIKECNGIIASTAEKINNITKSKKDIEESLNGLNQTLNGIRAKESELNNIQAEIKQRERWLTQIENDITTEQKPATSFESVINDLKARQEVLLQTVEQYKTKISLIETSKFIVSDEGVKNFIVRKMLKMLNGRLNYYLKQLDANCTCQFNEYFEENIINNRGKECSYFNFSGGERKRIDLAMLFTFMDIRRMQSNIFVNIAIYDELLDTSLDSIGIENTLTVLNDRAINNKEAIYIISHKSEAAKHATGEIIYLEKENDITKRKPYDHFVPTS